ncbi:hypothetical protein NUU61_006361 [Penicillium alfredii]|uniref:L-gulonate 3-dehydrogenase n=1 Tax=Penicillium alfredii TaxID=1506179 RepID=A0A9W9F0Z3_9EURO|nr:uncharacterized protein NUU61_006361 [Penicillium alfredii]KAJ5091491.1 hypothetical protein NUU61_006361 [Penicillium alfredii]
MSTDHHIALLGLGTIGLSMLALHLRRRDTKVTVYDPRPDYEKQLRSMLPGFLDAGFVSPTAEQPIPKTEIVDHLLKNNRLFLASSIAEAVQHATIIQEQSPEVTASKQAVWQEVTKTAAPTAHLWSSSSGVGASTQAAGNNTDTSVAARLLVAHPFNPPHLMPIIELVPGEQTDPDRVDFAREYFCAVPGPTLPASTAAGVAAVASASAAQASSEPQASLYYRPITLQREIPGFVGNRLAFALLREACYLVNEGVVSARDLDAIVTASIGPRWAVSGVFESYHAGGGAGGINAFLQKLAPTIDETWRGLGQLEMSKPGDPTEPLQRPWRNTVVRQTEEAYGPYTAQTKQKKDEMLRTTIEMQTKCWGELES